MTNSETTKEAYEWIHCLRVSSRRIVRGYNWKKNKKVQIKGEEEMKVYSVYINVPTESRLSFWNFENDEPLKNKYIQAEEPTKNQGEKKDDNADKNITKHKYLNWIRRNCKWATTRIQ